MNFYKSKQWERKRQRILRRDNYQCQYFKRYGRIVPATMVHHILPRDTWPEYELCDWNLISLSNEAHNKMHDKINTHDLSKTGIELAQRTIRKNGIKLSEE